MRKSLIIFSALVLILWLVVFSLPVSAQNGVQFIVLPEESAVPIGNDILIELFVVDGENINAYDVTIQYDADILVLDKWEHGDYLSNLAVVSQTNDPGVLRLAATQLATPAVSGDGVLLELSFSTVTAGETEIDITEAVFANSQGESVTPARIAGTVTVFAAATYTPTRTPTPTQTVAPQQTRTRTSVSIPTSTSRVTEPAFATVNPTSTQQTDSGAGTTTQPTLTSQAGGLTSTGAIDTAQSEGTPEAVSNAGEGDQALPQDAADPGESEDQSAVDDAPAFLNWLLWILLAASLLAMAVMGVIYFRRKKHNEQELL